MSTRLQTLIETNVSEAISKQLQAGIDVGNNGEQPRVGFSTYVTARMEGFGGEYPRPTSLDLRDFPDYKKLLEFKRKSSSRVNVTASVEDRKSTRLNSSHW